MTKLINLTNQTFGNWYVLSRAENDRYGKAMWVCKCTKCGETEKAVSGSHLRSGRSKACEKCRQKAMTSTTIKNETGKDYGFLHVERVATEEEKPRKDRHGVYWNCTCTKCGRKNVIIFGDYLRNGNTRSCGCMNSYNESNICKILDNLGIKYIQQKRFSDLTLTGRPCDELMFDIAVYDNDKLLYLIEFDGIQHFEKGHFHNSYERTHRNDLAKNKYCFKNKIPLIRIPYNADYEFNDLLLKSTRFLLTSENENQYYERN